MLKRILSGCAALVVLSSCTTADMMTRYDDMALDVEHSANGTILIRAFGNGYTPEQAVVDYAMLKAAEVTLAAGQQCFEVVAQGSQMNDISMAGQFGPMHFDKPSARLRIRVLEGVTECDSGNADAIVAELRTRVADVSHYLED